MFKVLLYLPSPNNDGHPSSSLSWVLVDGQTLARPRREWTTFRCAGGVPIELKRWPRGLASWPGFSNPLGLGLVSVPQAEYHAVSSAILRQLKFSRWLWVKAGTPKSQDSNNFIKLVAVLWVVFVSRSVADESQE